MTDVSVPSRGSGHGIRRLMRSAAVTPVRMARGIWREAPVWPALLGQGRGPVAVFLPAYGPEMSSLLRIYNIAAALRPLGWRTVVLPWTLTLAQRRRLLAALSPDLVVMQGARHDLNRPALYPGQRIVYDLDDADFHLDHLARPVTEAMGQVDLVLAGSRYVADWCRGQGARAAVVWTGTPISDGPCPAQADRPPVVAWAQSTPAAYVREAALVREVMARVAVRRPEVTLRLYGRRPGEDDAWLAPFRAAGIAVEWWPAMPYARYLRAFDDVAVGLSPVCPATPFSRGKSFGKILACLDRGVPVVTSDAADHALFFDAGSGVVSNDPAQWADAICGLLEDAGARQAMADRASAAFRARLTTAAAARQTDRALRRILAAAPQAQRRDLPEVSHAKHDFVY